MSSKKFPGYQTEKLKNQGDIVNACDWQEILDYLRWFLEYFEPFHMHYSAHQGTNYQYGCSNLQKSFTGFPAVITDGSLIVEGLKTYSTIFYFYYAFSSNSYYTNGDNGNATFDYSPYVVYEIGPSYGSSIAPTAHRFYIRENYVVTCYDLWQPVINL